jgi:hypothetical protein
MWSPCSRARPPCRRNLPLEDTEDYRLARGAAPALTPYAAGAEARLIDFDLARGDGRLALAFLGYALSDLEEDRGHALARQPR